MGRGRAPCCDKSQVKRGPWSPAEDLRLISFIQKNGHENWRALPKQAGLLRCGKSCRLRWINYLRPDVKRGNFTKEEEETIIRLHQTLGNKWSKIATQLPGRTDNEIKNVWNTHLKKRLSAQNVVPNGDEVKESSATSSSSSSSSTIMSSDDLRRNRGSILKKPRVLVNSQGSQGEVFNESRSSMEVKGLGGSSCISSNNSNATHLSQLDVSQNPENPMGSVLDFTRRYDSVHTTLEEVNKPGQIQGTADEIPLESDYDFWEMLDNLSAFQSNKFQLNNAAVGPLTCAYGEVENKKWMLYLENEHGLEARKDGIQGNQSENMVASPVPAEKFQLEKLNQKVNPGIRNHHLSPSL